MKIQSKLMSFIESWMNVFVGFGINYVANLTVLPFFGIYISLLDNLYIGIIYTVISVVRSYFIRRFMNWRDEKRVGIEVQQGQDSSASSSVGHAA